MGNVIKTCLKHLQAAIYCNSHILSSVYIGCGIMTLNEKE